MGDETLDTESGGPPRTPWWTAVWWAGVGVLLAGVGVLGYALAVADGEYLRGDGIPLTVVAGTTAATLTWVFLALRRIAARRLPPPWVTAPLTAVPVVGIGLLGHALTGDQFVVTATILTALATATWTYVAARRVRDADRTFSFPKPQALGTVALALAAAAVPQFAQWRWVDDAIFPGDRALLVTTAHGVMLLGTAAVFLAALRLPPRPQAVGLRSRRGIVGFVGGVTAVAVATVAVVAVAGDQNRVDATTTAAVPPPPTPTDLTQVAWRWSEGEQIYAAVPAGAGVVVSTPHGVVALDGRTGQERWHYRRDDTRPADLAAVDGGRGVIASIEGRLHAFDAFTGELRWRTDPPTAWVWPAWDIGISATDSTVIQTREGTSTVDFELAGTDARTGEPTWGYSPPPGCEWAGNGFVADMVIVALRCSPLGTVEIVALDGSTGQPVWREPLDESWTLRHGLLELSDPDAPGSRYLDPRTGREITELTQILGERNPDYILGKHADEVVTEDWQLFRLGEPGPRWQAQDTSPPGEGRADFARQAIFLRDSVVILDDRSCPGDDYGMELVVLDRDDGTRRGSIDCLDLEDYHLYNLDAFIFPAPGAVVLINSDSLIGISG
jgi:hypothetical protein